MKKNKCCCVVGCKSKTYGGWIDINDDITKTKNPNFGRFPFCKEHFNKVFPYIQKKEKEAIKKALKTGKKIFWCYAPLSVVEEALKK